LEFNFKEKNFLQKQNLDPAGQDGGSLSVAERLGREGLLHHHLVRTPVPDQDLVIMIIIIWPAMFLIFFCTIIWSAHQYLTTPSSLSLSGHHHYHYMTINF